MESPCKILIVEDEMIIGANISLQLSKLGYEVTGIISKGEEALSHVRQNHPDIVIMDIQLKGKMDGVDTAKQIRREFKVPIIYLTANVDEECFNRAKETQPSAFISKPFKKLDLQHAIELTIDRMDKTGFAFSSFFIVFHRISRFPREVTLILMTLPSNYRVCIRFKAPISEKNT